MIIKNKTESYNKIIELNLNKFPEEIFTKNDIQKIKNFIKNYPAKYYAIRDKSKSGGIFKLRVEQENILKEIEDYDLFSINVSSYNYRKNQVLVGEIFINNNTVNATLSTNKNYSVRDAINNPDFNISTNIYDNKTLDKIPYFDNVYKYIIENKLKNIIVEFSYFNTKLGINNENIIIYELRTNY